MARPNSGPRNRFATTFSAGLRVPLPANYVLGIDRQKFDFEAGFDSYLRGEWRHGGWWYYYLYGLAVKVPLGTWALLFMAMALGWALPTKNRNRSSPGGADKEPNKGSGGQCPPYEENAGGQCASYDADLAGNWRDEFVLLLPAVTVLALVSSQTGFNHHLRYVLPIFPFVFIWIGRLGRLCAVADANARRRSGFAPAAGARYSVLVAGALAWSVGSSLWYYPHHLSYFNELAGGPLGGRWHLLDSNLDWGQDVLYLKRWLDDHPEAKPLGFAYFGRFDPRAAGIAFSLPPLGPTDEEDASARTTADMGPKPGWYAVSVMMLHGYKYAIPDGAGETLYTDRPYFTYFQHFEPVAHAGYSIYIYHINRDEANRVRRLLGLTPLSDRLDRGRAKATRHGEERS
ncbi:MAG: hypothetical protein ACREHD_26205 [Pirellulales bacterium]